MQIVHTGGEDIPLEDPNKRNLVAEVSCKEKKIYNDIPNPVVMSHTHSHSEMSHVATCSVQSLLWTAV